MSFLTGYFLGQEAARQEQSFKELTAAVISRFQQNNSYAEPTELDLAYARITQLESWANTACAEMTRLGNDLAQSQENLAQSQKYAEWAGPEIKRLRAEVARLTARVREFEAADEAERVAVLDNVRRILGDEDDLPLG